MLRSKCYAANIEVAIYSVVLAQLYDGNSYPFSLSKLTAKKKLIIKLVFANHVKPIICSVVRGAVERLRVVSKVQSGVQEAASKCMTQISQCMSG